MIYKKLSSLTEISKAQLSKIFNLINDPKDLVFEPNIIKPLEKICGVKWLRSHKVQKLFKLEVEAPKTENNLIYLIYSNFATFENVVNQIRSQLNKENPSKERYHIILIPKSLYVFENILEELGISGYIKLYSLQWQPIHLDKGILSLELPQLFKTLYVDLDLSFLPIYAKSLWHLSFVFGKPCTYLALGQHSIAVLKQLDILNENLPNTEQTEVDFGTIVLLDRSLDYPSALLTPTTYAALLNEIYGVTSGICEHKMEELEIYDTKFNLIIKKEPVNITLDNIRDPIYKDIKNKHFTEVITILNQLTKTLRSEGESSKEMALDEIKKYVETKLQATASKKKLVVNHLSASQTIVNCLGHRFEDQHYTERLIIQNKNKSANFDYLQQITTTENQKLLTLRLMCLMSITQKLSASEYNSFYIRFLQEFGYHYGFIQNNLLKAGFITNEHLETVNLQNLSSSIVNKLPKFLSNDFYTNVKTLRQVPNDPAKVNLKVPTCCSYVYGGNYIPLLTQIASLILSNTPVNEIKSKLEPLGPLLIKNEKGSTLQPRCILIYIIGGVTYAEIAACNLLETLTDSKIIICSDRVISGNDLMKAVIEV